MADENTDEATPVDSTEVQSEPDTEAATESESSPDENEPDTFPRSYVEDLRQENGKYRQRAQHADDLAQRLHTELVRATGRLADPSDLEFAAEHLDDPEALTAAVDDLLERKPHLASRRPVGDVGQGQRGSGEAFSLLGMLKQHA